jgi:RNA polymerase sigma-70 factor (ECF subfamily)
MSLEPTQALVGEAGRGDRRAIEALLERYLPQVRAFVRLRVGPDLRAKESSSDIAQSVCRELLQGMDDFKWQGEEAFRAWLFTAALRKVSDKARHYGSLRRDAGREQASPDGSPQDQALWAAYRSLSSPSEHAVAREQAERLERAFARLDEEEREVVTLARIVGLSRAEIGARIGKSEGAVRVMLHRALARLTDHLGDS